MAERVSVIDVCALLLPTQCLHTLSFLLINVHYYNNIIILSVSLHVVFTCVVPTGPDTCWLVGWLNVSNAELSPKRYLQRSRSQEVGEEADYT